MITNMATECLIKNRWHNAKNKKLLIVSGIAILLAVSFWPFPHSIQLYGKVMPCQRWVLMRAEDGQVSCMTVNYLTGMQENFYANQMERGEIVQLVLQPDLARRERVVCQDTLAVMTSSEAEERLAELMGERDVALATLMAARSGEKQSVIDTYRHRLEQAQFVAEEKKSMAERAARLYEKKLVSLEEYEMAVNASRVAQSEVESAMAQLTDIRTGVKPEELQLLQAKIEAQSRQIELTARRIKSFTILAPFSGAIETMVHSDTLLILSDDSRHTVLLPARVADCGVLHNGMTVACRLAAANTSHSAIIYRIGKEIRYLNGESVRLVTADLLQPAAELSPGTILDRKSVV